MATSILLGIVNQLVADDLIAPTLELTPPSASRAVVGSSPILNYGLYNTEAAESSFNLSATNGTFLNLTSGATQSNAPATPGTWTAATLAANAVGVVSTQANLAGIVAGGSQTITVAANRADWNDTPSAAGTIQVVENRLLTGGAVINAGRHIYGTALGTLTLNGGAKTDLEASRITVNVGGYAQFADGLRLTSADGFTFNGADQTHDITVSHRGNLGSFSIVKTLPGTANHAYTDATGQARNDFGGSWDVRANYGQIDGDTNTFTQADATTPTGTTYFSNPYTFSHITRDMATSGQPSARPAITTLGDPLIWELSRGTGVTKNERVNSLLSAETIPGAALDLGGVSVEVSGTAVANRTITGGTTSLGRYMVGTAEQVVNLSNATIHLTTFGSDDTHTRLSLGNFELSNGTITATSGGGTFNSESGTADVTVNGSFTRTHENTGIQYQTVNAAAHITGEGLLGETVQNNLEIGYSWTVVQNNTLESENFLVVANAGSMNTSFWNSSVQRTLDYNEGTNISYNANVAVNGTFAAGLHDLGNTTLNAANERVTAEGLVGETVIASTTFNTRLAAVSNAAHTVTPSVAGPLGEGDTLTIADTGSGVYQANVDIRSIKILGNESGLYEIDIAGDTTLDHQAQTVLTIDYTGDTTPVSAGQLGRIARASLDLTLGAEIDINGIAADAGANRYIGYNSAGFATQSQSYALETRFDAPAAAAATSTIQGGTNFAQNGVVLTNTEDNKSSNFAAATEFQVRDGTLASTENVTVSFQRIDDVAIEAVINAAQTTFSQSGVGGTEISFASDIVNLSGLDGIKHAIQITFDADAFADGGIPMVIWQSTYADEIVWINAVLGNSNISNLNLSEATITVGDVATSISISDYLAATSFGGSYSDYLASLNGDETELGRWGYSKDDNQAWAVIDHNSSFAVAAAVPEPASFAAIVGLSAIGVAACRRRRRLTCA